MKQPITYAGEGLDRKIALCSKEGIVSLKYNTVFILTVYDIQFETEGDLENCNYVMPTYPEYGISEFKIGIYSTLRSAEEVMFRYSAKQQEKDREDNIENINEWLYLDKEYNQICAKAFSNIHSFEIAEHKLDFYDSDRCWAAETRRSYTPDGKLIDESLVSETEDAIGYFSMGKTIEEWQSLGVFMGRMPEKIRFKKGDIVEILSHDHVRIGIVQRVPDTIEEKVEVVRRYAESNPEKGEYGIWGDYSDDIYLVLASDEVYNYKKGDNPEYFNDRVCICVSVFKPRFPVPEELKKTMESALKAWDGDD